MKCFTESADLYTNFKNEENGDTVLHLALLIDYGSKK